MLPFRGESFDVVLCSELLEHVPDPIVVLREAYRVLQAPGILLLSVPFLFHVHADPHDYGRYTDQYWKENLDLVGFRDVTIEKQGLFWSVIVDMMRGWICERIRTGHLRSVWLQHFVTMLFGKGKRWALDAEKQIAPSDEQYISRYTTGFGIRAVKP
jgi:SAM-dependent methyltransferase